MFIKGQFIQGSVLDDETRCAHYHTENDRIAIKFYCCGRYFPCFKCHQESGCENPQVWPKEKINEKAILCGSCGYELTISQYFTCNYLCPACSTTFNSSCHAHKHLYFET